MAKQAVRLGLKNLWIVSVRVRVPPSLPLYVGVVQRPVCLSSTQNMRVQLPLPTPRSAAQPEISEKMMFINLERKNCSLSAG